MRSGTRSIRRGNAAALTAMLAVLLAGWLPAGVAAQPPPLQANLAITKDDGVAAAVPGESVTYLITVSNPGPNGVAGARVTDLFPAELDCTWTCAPSPGAGCTPGPVTGDIVDFVDLPIATTVSFTAECNLAPSATDELVNTASVLPPPGVIDPDTADNVATDTDVLTPLADLGITKDDGLSTAVPGEVVTYTVIASNAVGPSDVVGVSVTDPLPEELSCTWTCVGSGGATCTPGPVAGDLIDVVDLPVGSAATYTGSCLIDSAATDSVINSATIDVPDDVADLDLTNNDATDVDELAPAADLEITKDDGSSTAIPGVFLSYTLTATNHGPSDAPGATVSDDFPDALEGVGWICTPSPGASCTAAGSGDLADVVSIPAGGSVTYVAVGIPDAAATGTLSNTATIAGPSGVAELDTANNSATDDDELVPTGNLAISGDDGRTSAVPGTEVTYTMTASNAGPSAIAGATVSDVFPGDLEDVSWTCFASEGASCGAESGSGDIAESVDLGVGSSVTFSATATIAAAATGFLSNTATVAVPAGSVDPEPGNDAATDVDALDPQADLTITNTDGQTTAILGLPLTYTITATNDGPGAAPTASVIDPFPGLAEVTWTCTAAGGATCTASGSGSLGDAVSLPAGASVTYTATGTVKLDAASPLVNTATVLPTGGLTDPDGANNSAGDQTDLVAGADLAVTKDDGRTAAMVGEELTYLIVVTNNGPIDVVGAEVSDPFPPELLDCSWSCVPTGTAHCTSVVVAGDVVDTVDVPVGESVVFMALCVVAEGSEEIVNTATATVPASLVDPDPTNDVATDTTTVALFADGFESGDTSAWSDTVGQGRAGYF